MLKPVFVPKNKRATIAEREELELEEERVAEQEAQRLQERKEESKVPATPFLIYPLFLLP
jgi:microfibrillar-associated protein 1